MDSRRHLRVNKSENKDLFLPNYLHRQNSVYLQTDVNFLTHSSYRSAELTEKELPYELTYYLHLKTNERLTTVNKKRKKVRTTVTSVLELYFNLNVYFKEIARKNC